MQVMGTFCILVLLAIDEITFAKHVSQFLDSVRTITNYQYYAHQALVYSMKDCPLYAAHILQDRLISYSPHPAGLTHVHSPHPAEPTHVHSPLPAQPTHVHSPLPAQPTHVHSPLPAGLTHVHSPLPAGLTHVHSPLPTGLTHVHSPLPAGLTHVHSPLPAGLSHLHRPHCPCLQDFSHLQNWPLYTEQRYQTAAYILRNCPLPITPLLLSPEEPDARPYPAKPHPNPHAPLPPPPHTHTH